MDDVALRKSNLSRKSKPSRQFNPAFSNPSEIPPHPENKSKKFKVFFGILSF
jgi:hypothetical protein